jgi:DNA repair protein RecO (recombination protein O)
MPLVSTPAIILSTLRYAETSKIVRLVTLDHGVQSVIAKGAMRPRSRFGAALQLFSEGQSQFLLSDRRELHTLTAFDVQQLRLGLAQDLERYAATSVLAEVMLRFSPADPHPEAYQFLQHALALLESVPATQVPALGLRLLWTLVSILGFAPALDGCVRDGVPIPEEGPLPFSTEEGGALCVACAASRTTTRLAASDRADLETLLDLDVPLPTFDAPHDAAHRRLLARYIQHHVAEGSSLPALEFWQNRPWRSA